MSLLRRLSGRRRFAVLAGAGALVAATLVALPGVAYAAPGCSVQYQKAWDSGSGFGANINITNTGDPINGGWSFAFSFAGNQRITDAWPTPWTQTGQQVTYTNATWNANVGTGGQIQLGFNGSYSGANANPTVFTLNGTTCNSGATPTLVVNPVNVSVPEGGVAMYAVHLSAAPSSNVTVTSTRSAGDTDVTVSAGGSLTFTPTNFANDQNVTLAAAEDADTANGTATITVSATGNIPSVNVTATETDNDPGQAIVLSTATLSVPEGGQNMFGVRLQAAPPAGQTVTVTCAVDAAGDASITVVAGTGTKNFTSANFGTDQNVTVAAAEDADSTNGSRVINCTSAGLTTRSVTATEADNDPPNQSIVVTPAAISVPEGGQANFGVNLSQNPGTATITVTCAVAATGDASITVVAGTGTKTFTSANFATPQNVSVAAAEDADNTNGTRAINCTATNIPTATVTATEADNDPAQAIVVAPASLPVAEGSTAPFGVHLAADPGGTVTVTCAAAAGGDADLTVVGGTVSLTFTSANFGTNQNVTVAAAQDADGANGTRTITCTSAPIPSASVTATEVDDEPTQNQYLVEFMTQYDKIKNPANGYFSPEGIPYHSVETLMVEAPDHGHETTSEAFSFWIWLEAQFGRATGNWVPFNNAWNITEQFIIPTAAGQPGLQTSYNPSDPADYAPEFNQPSQYPAPLSTTVVAGSDPLAGELQSTYGNRQMYAMHWILDVDNTYGFGNGRGASLTECGDNTPRVTYMNTYQRGPQESVWETVPHPSCETGRFGQSGTGFPPLFIAGSGSNQWRYTNAPDADARAIEAAYWALRWATEQGNQSQISASIAKAAKLGDFLRYAFYDKYFKNHPCTDPTCAAGSGKSSSNFLLSWYFAWGGDNANAWSWRIGSSHNHGGYQNPVAAWAMSDPTAPAALKPLSPTADDDWAVSLTRQVQFMAWLQSNEGAIAGGATNSWDGAYAVPPAGTPTFFGMAYDVDPVYHDPPSNQWFGFQAWGQSRLAEYYFLTGNALAKSVLDKWVTWAISQTTLGTGSNFLIPSEMSWSGAPSASFSGTGNPAANPGLHVTVTSRNSDVGVAAAYARTLIAYAARPENTSTPLGQSAKNTAKGLLDRMLLLKDTRGISVCETRSDYERFNDVWTSAQQKGLFVPPSFSGTMPNGNPINSSSTFLSIRTFFNTDQTPTCTGGAGSGMAAITAFMNGGTVVPDFRYHRFWAQADFAMALADYGNFFPAG